MAESTECERRQCRQCEAAADLASPLALKAEAVCHTGQHPTSKVSSKAYGSAHAVHCHCIDQIRNLRRMRAQDCTRDVSAATATQQSIRFCCTRVSTASKSRGGAAGGRGTSAAVWSIALYSEPRPPTRSQRRRARWSSRRAGSWALGKTRFTAKISGVPCGFVPRPIWRSLHNLRSRTGAQ